MGTWSMVKVKFGLDWVWRGCAGAFFLCESLNCGECIPVFRGNNSMCVYVCIHVCVQRSNSNTYLEREYQKKQQLARQLYLPYSFIKGTELESLRTVAVCYSPCGPYLDFNVCWGFAHWVLWRNFGFIDQFRQQDIIYNSLTFSKLNFLL